MKREDLKNGEIYAIDKENSKQIFMFSSFSKTETPYSILIESPNLNIEKFQENEISKGNLEASKEYLSQNGPKIIFEEVRETSEREKKYFKRIIHDAGYSIDPETQVVTSYDNVEKELVESTKITNRYKELKSGEIYYFEVSNDASVGCSVIIGQVEDVNGASIKLSAYAHQSDLKHVSCPIYNSTVIVAPQQYRVPNISDYYKFVHHLISVLEDKPGIEPKRIETLYHYFAKRLIEDVDTETVILVHHSEKDSAKDAYYAYMPISALDDKPLCEVTNVICKMFTDFYTSEPKDRTRYLEASFGEGRVVELDEYLSAVELMKTAQTAILDNVANQEEIADKESDIHEEELLPDGDNEVSSKVMANPHKNFGFDQDTHIVYPGIYDSTMEAANDISITDDGFYIIINNLMSSEIVFKLTDDPHSVLHSRKLIHNGYTAIYGPLRDAEETFWFLINQLQEKYGYMYDSKRGVLVSSRTNTEELIGAITKLQKNTVTPYGYAYRIFELPLNRLKDY